MAKPEVAITSAELTKLLIESFEDVLRNWNIQFSSPPKVGTNHIKYAGSNLMAMDGKDKGFYEGSCIAVVNYYTIPTLLRKKSLCGFLSIYIGDQYLEKLFSAIGFPVEEKQNEEFLKDFCRELSNMVIGGLDNRLKAIKCNAFMESPCQFFKNVVPEGVEYPKGGNAYDEIRFHIWDQNPIVVDFCLSTL